jgi:hypothetical protein
MTWFLHLQQLQQALRRGNFRAVAREQHAFNCPA